MVRRTTASSESVQWHLSKLDQICGRGTLKEAERWCLLRVFFALNAEHRSGNSVNGVNRPLRASSLTARLCGRGKNTVDRIVSAWHKSFHSQGYEHALPLSKALEPTPLGNRFPKSKRIPHDDEVLHLVRDFVQRKRKLREKCTAPEVLDFLVQEGACSIRTTFEGVYEPKDFQAALCAVRRYLQRKGFKRGRKTGAIRINPVHVAWRDTYLRVLLENRSKADAERRQEVYTDESYIHHHYRLEHDNIYHPLDEGDTKAPQKGRRYCFVAAIRANGRDGKGGLVPNSVWSFCPTSGKDHKGDYHKVFNYENYLKWFTEQLLPNLFEPSLIILDNAKYHKTGQLYTPNASKMRKAQVLEALTARGVQLDPNATAMEAKVLLRKWVTENVKPAIIQAAEASGHKVIFTPPHYSDLQPIELLWARVKGAVARLYTKETTLRDDGERLQHEFEKLESEAGEEAIAAIVDHVDNAIRKFLEEIARDERHDDSGFTTESDASTVSDSNKE